MTANAAEAVRRTADGRPWVVWDPEEAKRNISPEALAQARAELDAEVAAYHLSEIRKAQGRTQTDVALEMGVSQKRVSTIESAELARTEVDTIARYVNSLGGRLRLVADFPGHTITIR
jgi:DNA-binding XRE family transcriptional regulator